MLRQNILSEYSDEELIKVYDIEASITFIEAIIDGIPYPVPQRTLITCRLEDGREFRLYSVPIDIVEMIRKIKGYNTYMEEEFNDDRETLYDIILTTPNAIDALGRHLRRVVIDSINPETYTYSATAEFGEDKMIIRRKMIPSHAILLALITHRPIYIRKVLVDQQEEFREESEEDLDIF